MRFVVDAQLPLALARWITWQSHEAEHVNACGLRQATDAAIWAYAERTGAIIITKDEDFAQRKGFDPAGPVLVWIRMGNTRRGQLLAHMEQAWLRVMSAVTAGETLIEIV